jgi:hypothetical protein
LDASTVTLQQDSFASGKKAEKARRSAKKKRQEEAPRRSAKRTKRTPIKRKPSQEKASRESIKSCKNSTGGSYPLLAFCSIITVLGPIIQNNCRVRGREIHGN